VRVTVVGGGVVRLTTALALAEHGHAVECVRDLPVLATVSRVAGGLWFPYHCEPRERTRLWAKETHEWLVGLSGDPATGVRVARGTLVGPPDADLWWAQGLDAAADVRPATAAELPPGVPHGTSARLPLVDTGRFLPWLEQRCVGAGVRLRDERVVALADLVGDAVVVAAGLRSGELTGDDALAPGRGQVVRLRNPGLDDWLVDGEDPEALPYVLPHGDTVICGGTDVEGEWSTEPDPEAERAILARCRERVPALASAERVDTVVGLRPLAPEVRLVRDDDGGRPVVTNYGHGGAGVTLARGCALEVVRLLDALPSTVGR
jgi:D-amino-acid oxidase